MQPQLEPMEVVVEPAAKKGKGGRPKKTRLPPLCPSTREFRRLVKEASTGGGHPTWRDFKPFVQPLEKQLNGVTLRRSTRSASKIANQKMIYQHHALYAVAEGF